jgi:hypothetical protein
LSLVNQIGAKTPRQVHKVPALMDRAGRAARDYQLAADSPRFRQPVNDKGVGQPGGVDGTQARDQPGLGLAGNGLAGKDDQGGFCAAQARAVI